MSGIPATDLLKDQEAYPRPQLRRQEWRSLNGTWEFSKGRESDCEHPSQVTWDCTILVPFSPETTASGLADTGFYSSVWYRRTWEQQPLATDERLIVHFEAVDWKATVWVNGVLACTHAGGYTPFNADITTALREGETQEIVVRAEDDPGDLAKPRGKQDWQLEPHSIWYPRTTGIWQTVWLEKVPCTRIRSVQWTSNLERWEIGVEAHVDQRHDRPLSGKLQLNVQLTAGKQLLSNDTYQVIADEVHRQIALSDPGIDDFRNELLWSPASPTLIDVAMELRDEDGTVLDRVRSYAALRAVTVEGDRFLLNGRPFPLKLVLDQGYWPETGLTAPNDDALAMDIVLTKQLGFNGVRKHQKIESARYLYWADRLGLLVWEEMPSAYRYTTRSIQRLTREWQEVLHRDRSHPCIVAWVPFNESWGVPNLPESPAQRHYVQALYHLTKTLDPSRPVVGNDGWESVATDLLGIHDYDDEPERIGMRYGIEGIEAKLLRRERPGGRALLLSREDRSAMQPIVLTEFGGIALSKEQATWGYSRSQTADQLLERYRALLGVVRNLPALAGFCYTQLTDTYQEANGLLYADRSPKAAVEAIAAATSGVTAVVDSRAEGIWKAYLAERDGPASTSTPPA